MAQFTRDQVKDQVTKWNQGIDDFLQFELPELLENAGIPVVNGKISMTYYIKAMEIANSQDFYKKAYDLMVMFRNDGYDVKIDCSNKLTLY